MEAPEPPAAAETVTNFGFWPGEWLVLNTRRDLEHAVYVDAGSARATVEPVLGGEAYLERWQGVEGAIEPTFGISLVSFEPARDRWVSVRCWPGGDPLAARFTRVEGVFGDGIAPFHPPRVYAGDDFEKLRFHSTRSVFSDVSGDSFRWSMQMPQLELSWETTWAMEYVRESRGEVGPLRIDGVPDRPASGASEPRLTDWMVGAWGGDGVELRVSSALRGCGVVASVEVDRGETWVSSVLLIVWDESSGTWQLRELGLNRPLRSLVWESVGRVSDRGMVLRSSGVDELSGMVFRRLEGDGMQFELTLPDGGRVDVELAKR